MQSSSTIAERKEAIRHNQNELLYDGVRYSVAGSLAASTVAVYIFGPLAPSQVAVGFWFVFLYATYLTRAFDCRLFKRSASTQNNVKHWAYRFNAGALMSAVAWASSMWLIYPNADIAHQVLLVLTLGGVAGGALASLPYDTKLSNAFQLLILTSVITRLIVDSSEFALELALFSCFVFGFLLSCGKEVGKNYLDLLRLRQDSQETNLTLIRTSEKMARLGYWQWDLQSDALEMSKHLSLMLGFDRKKVAIKQCFTRMPGNDKLKVEAACARVIKTGEDGEVEFRVSDPQFGDSRSMRQIMKLISDSEGNLSLLGAVQDITDIKSAEQRIYKMAYYDELTGLANRAHFLEQFDFQINITGNTAQQLAIVYIDLDDFKGVNDSYGHACGDSYLKHFSNYLTNTVRETDLASRLGGDEFCILLRDFSDRTHVEKTVLRCLEYCQHPVQLGNHRIHPRMSVGVAFFPDNGTNADELIKRADAAMYTVKQKGKHGYAIYDSQMATDTMKRVRLEADLRQALNDDDFVLWYQPKIDISDNSMMGVEALIRWNHPERGIIPPGLFIHTAERVGLIKEIGEWVFVNACKQLQQWNKDGYRLGMAVNISGDHFASKDFCEFIISNVEKYDLHSADLEIEITESLTRNPEEHSVVCHNLRSHGIRIAIDDFGTGYSSLSVLGNLEVDTLKIDKSFIDNIATDPAAHFMVDSIIDLSLGLGYDVVAEGVETVEQLALLSQKNCPYVQGYLFSRPVQAIQIPILLHSDWALSKAG